MTETGYIDLSQYGFTCSNTETKTAQTDKLIPFSSRDCSLINSYTQDTSKLKISKTFFPGSDIQAGNITDAQKRAIKITVEGETKNGEKYGPEYFFYIDMANGVKELELPEHMSANALLAVLNGCYSRREARKILNLQ